MRVDLAYDEPTRNQEPEPRMAREDEGPIGGGSWQAHCSSCCRLTTHRAFTDDHGCDVGGGCEVCRWIRNPRECRYARAQQPQRRTA